MRWSVRCGSLASPFLVSSACWALRRTRLEPMGVRLNDLLASLRARGGSSGLSVTKVQRVGARRGFAYGIGGAAVLLGATLAPMPAAGEQAMNCLRATEQLNHARILPDRPCATLFPGERRVAAGRRQETADPVPAIVRRRRAVSNTGTHSARCSTSRSRRGWPTISIGSDPSSRSARRRTRCRNRGPPGCCCQTTSGNRGCSAG